MKKSKPSSKSDSSRRRRTTPKPKPAAERLNGMPEVSHLFQPDANVSNDRMQMMLSRLCTVMRGVDEKLWEQLTAIQMQIAANPSNPFGTATRAYLALLEARRVDQSALKTAVDCMAAAKLMAKQDDANEGQEQLSNKEVAGLLADMSAATDGKDSTEESISFGPVMGATLEIVEDSRPVASPSLTGTDNQLSDLWK